MQVSLIHQFFGAWHLVQGLFALFSCFAKTPCLGFVEVLKETSASRHHVVGQASKTSYTDARLNGYYRTLWTFRHVELVTKCQTVFLNSLPTQSDFTSFRFVPGSLHSNILLRADPQFSGHNEALLWCLQPRRFLAATNRSFLDFTVTMTETLNHDAYVPALLLLPG